MNLKLYSALAEWWPLLSSPADYAEEAAEYWRALSAHAARPIRHVLELGCGGGNNASHMKQWCQLTLTDVSPAMLAVSRATNPEAEHLQGDMRSLRLERQFDAVFVHDAVLYMRTEADLARAMATAFAHCVSGGVALFVTDSTRETWAPSTSHGGHDAGARGLRYLEWNWDPDPADTEVAADMVYVLRDSDGTTRVESERHHLGLFPRATWLRLLEETGFRARHERPSKSDCDVGEMFVGLRA